MLYTTDSMMQTESSRYSSTTVQTTVSPRKRATETQTLKKRKRAKKQSASVTTSATTSAVMVDADVDFDLGVIAKDRPLWTASSTQTRHVTYRVRRKFDSKVA